VRERLEIASCAESSLSRKMMVSNSSGLGPAICSDVGGASREMLTGK